MDAIVQQFFNLAIMERALPLILQGLRQTLMLCLIVIPLGLAGGLVFALTSLLRASQRCAGRRSSGSISFAPSRHWCF